jgi:hypothetical protein
MTLPGTATTFATTLAFAIAIKVTVAATATFHYMYTTLPYITSHDIALHEIQCGSCIRCILHCTQVQLQLPLKLLFPLPLLLRLQLQLHTVHMLEHITIITWLWRHSTLHDVTAIEYITLHKLNRTTELHYKLDYITRLSYVPIITCTHEPAHGHMWKKRTLFFSYTCTFTKKMLILRISQTSKFKLMCARMFWCIVGTSTYSAHEPQII